MSAMEVDGAPDAGKEETKGDSSSAPAASSAEKSQQGKGEGDRNVTLHPVRLFAMHGMVQRTASALVNSIQVDVHRLSGPLWCATWKIASW